MVGFEVEKVGEVRDARPARSKIRNLDFFFLYWSHIYKVNQSLYSSESDVLLSSLSLSLSSGYFFGRSPRTQ